MLKKILLALGIAVFAVPVFVAADTSSANMSQLVALYTQLVQILEQEITLLQNPAHASLSFSPTSGAAPFIAIFTVNNTSGTEAIDFGDGHSTGSSGCTKNAQGWCDLSKPTVHTYQFPGTYTVTLYDHVGSQAQIVSTSTVTVVSATQ